MERVPKKTPVYDLNSQTFKIHQIETKGRTPGWLFQHEAELVNNQFIKIVKGIGFYWKNNKQFCPYNKKTYWLHLLTQEWYCSKTIPLI